MAIIFVLLAVVGGMGFFLGMVTSYELKDKILCSIAMILCLSAPLIGLFDNEVVTSKEHVVLKQDSYEGVKYKDVVQIDYDLIKYNFWTFNFINQSTPRNVTVTLLDKK